MFTKHAQGLVVALGVGFWLGFMSPLVRADSQAGAGTPAGVLHLRAGDFATASPVNLLQNKSVARFAAGEHYVIQLDGPMTPARRAALARAGIELGDYLPEHAFITRLPAITPAAVAQLPFVKWLGHYQPTWRIDPQIGTRTYQSAERQAIAARGELALTVYLFEDEEFDPALAAIGQISGAQIASTDLLGNQPLINVVLPAASLPMLANVPAVQFVEEYPEFTLRNNSNRWIVQSNVLNFTPLYNHGLHGEGQILGHIDGQVAVNHCSFYDTQPIGPTHRKILAYNEALGYNAHGTHTAGIAVGDAGVFDETRGIAYLAKMVHNGTPVMTETQMFSDFNLHRSQGATVHTNSWGNDGTTAYDGACRAIDNFSWQYDDNLICFAVTNTSTLKNPENAKDVLAVGACQDTPNQANFCSGGTGPTIDGRRKPEIYAPGCSIQSSTGSTGCATVAMTGTSMACPAIAGTALLVRQYFTNGYYPSGAPNPPDAFIPSGALLKAILLNSAVDMTGISGYPSNQEGWGRVLADNALYFPGDSRKLLVYDVRNNAPGSLGTAESATYTIVVNSSVDQLRVTLVWHDAPATLPTSDPVVNNLDLTVTNPLGTVYLGNVFSGGVSIPGGSADYKNNVEQVHLYNPTMGSWHVTVSGYEVNEGIQGYALVVTGDVSGLVCPTIDVPPNSQTAAVGGSVTLTVDASGTQPFTYEWHKQGEALVDGGNLSGAATAALTINPVGLDDDADYDVAVTNACGSITSPAATLTVWECPAITSPPSPASVFEGTPVTLTVAASGTAPLAYEWRKQGVPLTDTDKISGTTTAALTINPVTLGDAGDYDVVVTNDCGSATSAPASLTVWECPHITSSPGSQSATEGNGVTLTVVASGAEPLSYQWRKQGLPLSEGGSLSGTTSASLTINPVALGDAGNYDVEVSNACDLVTSAPATLSVWARGDTNCDGSVDFHDINPFVLALADPAGYAAAYPQCPFTNTDINGDGSLNFGDINPFVALLSGPSAVRSAAQTR